MTLREFVRVRYYLAFHVVCVYLFRHRRADLFTVAHALHPPDQQGNRNGGIRTRGLLFPKQAIYPHLSYVPLSGFLRSVKEIQCDADQESAEYNAVELHVSLLSVAEYFAADLSPDAVSLPELRLIDYVLRYLASVFQKVLRRLPVPFRRFPVIVSVSDAGVLSALEHNSMDRIRILRCVYAVEDDAAYRNL